MHGLTVVPFTADHHDLAAELLARRHQLDRERVPALPARYTEPAVTQERLDLGAASGVIAFVGSQPAGFLLGEPREVPPEHPVASIYHPGSVLIRYDAHAAPAEPFDLYRTMYAGAAARWIDDGRPIHIVQTPADPIMLDAWASLGFGRGQGWALRDTSPLPGASSPGVRVRRATPDDAGAVFALSSALARFESGSPVYLPYPSSAAEASWRAEIAASLDDPHVCHWLAELDGVPVGLMTFNPPPAHMSPMLTPDRATNISVASVLPEARGAGVGATILRHGLADARARGMQWCRVSWMTANLMSSRFWPRQGFVPVAYRVVRVVDDRVLG